MPASPLSRVGFAVSGLSLALAVSAQTKPIFSDGQAQPVPAFGIANDWIRERLWVECEFDSDKNGKRDRVHVDVTRPKQTDTEAMKVPIIYESSPYFAGVAFGNSILWDVKQEVGAEPPLRTAHPDIGFNPNRRNVSNSMVSEWVPRGFAVVHSEAPGTGLSTGSPTVGGAPERLAPKAVIDWLNGRAKGFTTVDGSTEVKATWSTGKVGMTGTSYNGTIPLAAAVTGVDGLEAIIPVAPNTSYYHYYRSNGLVRHPGGWLGEDIDSLYDFINSGDPATRPVSNRLYRDGEFARGRDRRTGDYNEFWADRDLLKFIGGVKCAVLMAHAFNDWNVVPEHSVRISQALKGKVPLVQYFHQGGHGGDPPFELMNRWFTRYLYGIQNGVEEGPKSYIVREGGGAPVAYPDYPHPDAKPLTFHLWKGSKQGGIALRSPTKQGMQSLIDDVSFNYLDLMKAETSSARLLFETTQLKAPVHISGTPQITLRLSSNAPAANLSVYLVQLPWVDARGDNANLITRGWADPQNAKDLTKGGDFHSMSPGKPLKAGEFVNVTFDLQPDDQIIPAGRRIGLMIMSSDRDFTVWPKPGTRLTVDLDASKIRIPIVGGQEAFLKAGGF